MATPKQDMKRLKIITACHNHIQVKGASKRIVIMMPGAQKRESTRRFSRKGPRGRIFTSTHDGKNLLVMFDAAKLLTSLEKIRNA